MYSCPRCNDLVSFDPYGDPHCRCNTNNNETPMKTVLRWALVLIVSASLAWVIVFRLLPLDMPL
jgi:hypothetical protein